MLLGMDLPPPAGTSVEIAGAYATFARRVELSSGLTDISDVTPKFVAIGMRRARPARDGLGAGTPEWEWRVRLALGPSHDEQTQEPLVAAGRTRAAGTGRYENFALLYRQPLGRRNSVEIAWNRRAHKATDLVNLGGENQELGEQRILSAERADISLGWRHRRKDLELSLAARFARPEGTHTTARAFHASRGPLYGVEAEARLRRGNWQFRIAGEAMEGEIDVHEESVPDFASRDFSADATFRAVTLAISRRWGGTDVVLSATHDRSRLPFVALDVLGYETNLFDSGFHPDSRTEETIWDLSVRRAIAPQVKARLFLRAVYGRERLTLTDSSGRLPAETLTLQRGGDIGKGFGSLNPFGSPQFVIGIGADFSLGQR